MLRIAPVNLPFNVKTLWFDADDLDIQPADDVVVTTARGLELGRAAGEVFEMPYEKVKALKSPLKPVERVATPEDIEQAREMERLSREAMPIFKEMAREASEDMHPVSVEYLLDGSKAVFYFEAEERVDFRELVRKLASRFKVRVDMRQIGVRDEARIVGGIGHCGQLICCKRMGGEFKPVSIRMAKDQDLSLNPTKISGLCGRLLCCLRYENEAYKDFKQRAPKVGNTVRTPDGPAKVESLDIPRETVKVRVEGENPVSVPLSSFEPAEEGKRPNAITDEGWEEAVNPVQAVFDGPALDIFQTSQFTGLDKLGSASAVHHEGSAADPLSSSKRTRKRRRSQKVNAGKDGQGGERSGEGEGSSGKGSSKKPRQRRRSTKIQGGKGTDGAKGGAKGTDASKGGAKKKGNASGKNVPSQKGGGGPRPGQKSSGLSHKAGEPSEGKAASGEQAQKKRRRRRHKPSGQGKAGGSSPESGAASKGRDDA